MSDSRSIVLAIAGSALLHLLLLVVLAVFFILDALFAPPLPTPPEPETVEIIIEIEEPEEELAKPHKTRRYVRTTQNTREEPAPEDSELISDRNTTVASETTGEELPDSGEIAQEGKDLPWVELADREYVDGELGEDATLGDRGNTNTQPTPETSPETLEKIATAPPPSSEKLRDLIADTDVEKIEIADLLESSSPPEKNFDIWEPGEISLDEPTATTQKKITEPSVGDPRATQRNIFQPQTRQTHAAGRITNRNKAAVSASETALGHYSKSITQAIERQWNFYRLEHSDFVTYGNIRLAFEITPEGKTENLKILENSANAVMADFTLDAILDANIPAIPADVIKLLGGENFNMTYDIVIY